MSLHDDALPLRGRAGMGAAASRLPSAPTPTVPQGGREATP